MGDSSRYLFMTLLAAITTGCVANDQPHPSDKAVVKSVVQTPAVDSIKPEIKSPRTEIPNVEVSADKSQVRVGEIGTVFLADSSNSSLGAGWKDPSGKIWKFNKVGDEDGWDFLKAKTTCESRAAHIPSRTEILKLIHYMGFGSVHYPRFDKAPFEVWSGSVWIDQTFIETYYASIYKGTEIGLVYDVGQMRFDGSYDSSGYPLNMKFKTLLCVSDSTVANPLPPRPVYSPEPDRTINGNTFVRDRSQPRLGEAWRDPRGVIWGDIVADSRKDGVVDDHYTSFESAADYCRFNGFDLPTASDFAWLSHALGNTSPPQVSYFEHGVKVTGHYSPTLPGSSIDVIPNLSKRTFYATAVGSSNYLEQVYFNGSAGWISGSFNNTNTWMSDYDNPRAKIFSFRCVVHPSKSVDTH